MCLTKDGFLFCFSHPCMSIIISCASHTSIIVVFQECALGCLRQSYGTTLSLLCTLDQNSQIFSQTSEVLSRLSEVLSWTKVFYNIRWNINSKKCYIKTVGSPSSISYTKCHCRLLAAPSILRLGNCWVCTLLSSRKYVEKVAWSN